MFLTTILFYLFSTILIASSLVVVNTKNTVYCVMFLILAFFNSAGLFILLGAEFLAMLLVIVYVGAIAVLFLFVVMMLNVDDKKSKKICINRYYLIGFAIGLTLLMELVIITQVSSILFQEESVILSNATPKNISNTQAIGDILYTNYAYPFQMSGIILFIAMIGAIVLTLREENRFIRKQNISKQTLRKRSDSISVVSVESGKGINI